MQWVPCVVEIYFGLDLIQFEVNTIIELMLNMLLMLIFESRH